MNNVAGNITFEKKVEFNIEDLFFVETENKDGTYNYFLYGKTYIETSALVLEKLESIAGVKSINFDISISTEDNIKIFLENKMDGIYTITSFEGSEESFSGVIDRFSDSSPYIVSVREAENSKKFGNRIIKIDIVN